MNLPDALLRRIQPGHLDDHGLVARLARFASYAARMRRNFISLSSFALTMLASYMMRSSGF